MAHRYILACVVFIFCRVDGESLYGLKGLSVSVKPDIPGRPSEILWKHKGNILIEFDGKEEQVYGTFKNRTTLDWHTADIVIKDLRFEDSGNYELEVTINNMLHRSAKTLVVIDKVPKPVISCKMNNGSSSNKSGTLECSAESEDHQTQSLTKFEWKSHGSVQPGRQLTISLGDKHDDHEYICNVSNPMSSETTTFTAKECYPDESSSVSLAAGLVILFLIISVVLGVVYICYRKRKACFAVKGDDAAKQSPPGSTENVSDNHNNEDNEESLPFLHTSAANESPDTAGLDVTTAEGNGNSQNVDETYRPVPVERLKKMFEGIKRTAPPPVPLPREVFPELAKEEDPQSDPSVSEKTNEPDQGDKPALKDTDLHETAAQGDRRSSPIDESEADQPSEIVEKGLVQKRKMEFNKISQKELKKEAEKDGGANVPSDSVFPSAKAPSSLTQNSPNVATENAAGEHSQDMDKPVSTSENEPVNEETDEENYLYGDTSQQPQSPIPTKTNNEHTNTLQESPDAAHKTSDQEKVVKTMQDSDESSEDED